MKKGPDFLEYMIISTTGFLAAALNTARLARPGPSALMDDHVLVGLRRCHNLSIF